ncbi:hypothetical protein C8J57DRAFT_1464240 [Mycena rebaudengoi]|nr:hypothetical protein C8J57DRAFT_1464240 [Mycena rebaudengoi]
MAVQLYNATSNSTSAFTLYYNGLTKPLPERYIHSFIETDLEPLTPTLDSDPATNLNFESPSSTAAELALFQAILDSNPMNTSTLEPTTDFALWNALLESTAMSNLTPEYIQSAQSADVSTESVFPELPGNLGTQFFDSAVHSEFNAANFDAEFWKRDAEDDGSSEHLQKKRRGQTVLLFDDTVGDFI